MEDITGKVAFITGGGSGIGLGMAEAFLSAGMKVAIADIRTDRMAEAASQLKEKGHEVLSVEADVRSPEELSKAADAVEAAYGKVHVVCNNAGVGGGGMFEEMGLAAWERVLDINLWGVVHGAHVFAPRIKKHGEGGHIINTASIMGMIPGKSISMYSTSKFAVVGFSECLRQDLADDNIGVSVVCPFIVDTRLWHPDLEDDDAEGIAQRKQNMPVMKLALQPLAVGEMALKAIQNNSMYVFGDGDASRQMVRKRIQGILDEFDQQFPE
ncbi:MAG: SDR family NAD(P)-dependent oxidoreductase [Pseudomonadota bacterium]